MNNIKNKILIFTLVMVLFGCSKSATSVFEKDPIYGQNMQYSKLITISEEDTVKAIFNITYLNSVNAKKWDNKKQNFLIGKYVIDNNTTNYSLLMNNLQQ